MPGPAIGEHIADIAQLRIAVFREWPYLYDGDLGYEATYLSTYTRAPDSVVVLAFDGDRLVGASTGLPLADEDEEYKAPFLANGLDVERVFYCGESVLLPAYRGRGLGHAFFDAREAHARALGRFDTIAFAAVDREAGDPRRPAGHRGNEAFWDKRGYARHPGMTMHLAWKEIGEAAESEKPLTFWMHPLEATA
ncbi:GNAT family N-acetyltransferase [Lysobacter sp. KIS68-7]|uniref:GNAT family N-acetyltransferase n=1 Tax=Lysobacter sp. KIS68-7 TaxID=2904252 RepID=UPI001E42637A|nr:GNAT family N-acetyltransferase [Lysobacter sp. KIS68-7]UHQ21046.1 GNAT family N-acetyltransferase [Lysobacter sp. KIS68-7]